MIDVAGYIKLILQKKKWTYRKLCDELNKIEQKLGDKRTKVENISNYLNGQLPFRPKVLVKYELALDLPFNTLISMVTEPISKEGKLELQETIKKVRG